MKQNIILYISLFILLHTGAAAQTPTPTPILYSEKTLDQMKQIQAAALQSDYAYRQTQYLSYNIGARLSGSPQAQRAVEYVAGEMKKLGLDVRLEKVTVPHWVRGEEKGELVEWEGMAQGTTQKVVLTALGGSIATAPDGMVGDIIVVNNFDELNALGADKVKGKIVLFNYKYDQDLAASGFGGAAYGRAVAYRGGGAIAAAKLGAVAVLVRSAGGSQNRLAHTGVMRYADGVTKIPAAAISYEDAEMIAYLSKMGRVKIKLTLTPQTLPDETSYNVIADLKGSEKPDEIVLVSGHLDSWDLGQGAIDDGAGVAVSMQVLQLMKQLKLKPKRTIRFVAWMNEENGTAGGKTYAKEEDAAKHFAVIESDLGASHALGFNFAGKPEALPMFAPISNILSGQGAPLSQMQQEVGTDVDPLSEKGVPSFSPAFDQRTYFKYHHTAADTFDKINPKEMQEVGSVMAVLALGLANFEGSLPR